MRCVIANSAFYLLKSDVLEAMKGIKPETVSGASVTIGRRTFPVKQVGEVVTRQDRRDFTAEEMGRALTRLGFTCHGAVTAPEAVLTPQQTAAALLGTTPQA
ncbi:SCO5918 family protein [Streptomyces sp. 8N114]|uniref:SCO5918 family protein n=1 Tax=Streptomyces sp. 8N114 TaxID=3457419 RepID=UPI003FCF8EA8